MDKLQDAVDILKAYNQEHIIKLLQNLDEEHKENLINDIYNIDFL